MIGLTPEILSKIEKRQKQTDNKMTSTALYQAVSTMKEYRLSPSEWRRLLSFDKKVLTYTRMMEQHYLDSYREEAEKKRDIEDRQRQMMKDMPALVKRR